MRKLPFKQHIADLALLLKRHGVRHAVICPGSRNAPLIQVLQRDPDFSCFSIVDERSAGYVALGIARQSGRPVAIVTTSGTAALNLAPAVAEAFYQQIPLMVLTADRPPEWPPQFGNQRINQVDIFKSNVKGSYSLPPGPMSEDTAGQVIRQASAIIGTALTGPKGPVHLNVPLNEPLYETVADAGNPVRSLTIKEAPAETAHSPQDQDTLSVTESRIISTALADQKKVLLIAGMKAYNSEEREVLIALTKHYQVTLIAENITNLGGYTLVTQPGSDHATETDPRDNPNPKNSLNPNNDPTTDLQVAVSETGFVNSKKSAATNGQLISLPELSIASAGEEELKALQPELVVTFGGQVVSKKTRLFVQKLVNVPVIATEKLPLTLFHQILTEATASDPDDTSAERGAGDLTDNRKTIMEASSTTNNYLKAWKKQEAIALQRAATCFTTAPFSNLTATTAILGQVPPTTTVHLGNSGTIRYAQLAPTRTDLTYHSNRGTSGIDGSLSAAAGAAMVSPGPHLAILGDLSFVYDSNALWNKNFPKNLKIIVLNDQGGGIFRLLEGPSRMPFFEEFSVAHHPVDLQHLANAFGLKHLYASDIPGLKTALATLFTGDTGPALLEVNTAKSENSAIFKQFFKSLRNE